MKVRKRISAILMAIFVLFSSTLVPFYNAEHVYAGSFVPVLGYSLLEVLEWIFLACGVTVSVSAVHDSGLGDEIVDEIADSFQLWYTANGFDTFGEDVKTIFLECLAGGVAGTISVTQDLWSLIKGFAQSLSKGETSISVSDGYDAVSFFNNAIVNSRACQSGYNCFFEDASVLDTVSEYCQKYGSENVTLYKYEKLTSRYGGAAFPIAWILIFGESQTYFTKKSDAAEPKAKIFLDAQKVNPVCHMLLFNVVDTTGRVQLVDSSELASLSYVSDVVLFSDRSSVIDSTFENYTSYWWSFVCQNSIDNIGYENIVAECEAISYTNGLVSSGNYDVLSKGQTAVGAGDVTITIPEEISVSIDGINSKLDNIEKALEKIQAGSITAGDVLDDAYVYPVDVAAGESVYEYEDEEGNSAVLPIDQVQGLLDELAKDEVIEGGDSNNDDDNNSVDVPTPAILPEGVFDMLNTLKGKFPFCIPFDLVAYFKNFKSSSAEELAPVFTFSIPMPFVNYTWEFTVDMSNYWQYVKIFRFGLLATFIIGLMYSTYKLVAWQLPS